MSNNILPDGPAKINTIRPPLQRFSNADLKPLVTPREMIASNNLVDLLAGRLFPGIVRFDPNFASASAHMIIPASPRRVAIHFVGPNTNRVTVSNEPGVTLDNGLTFSATAGILSIDSKIAGDVVTREWYAIYPANSTALAWIEVYAPDNM